MKFLTVEEVVEIHDVLLLDHGGLPGVRDKNLLVSSVETPRATMFGQFLHPTVYDKAAAYLYHIVQNHPFNDGNKRTGAFSTLVFLEANEVVVTFSDDQYQVLVLQVAKGAMKKNEIAKFLSENSVLSLA